MTKSSFGGIPVKLDFKKKKLQIKYREKLREKHDQNFKKEILIVSIMAVIILLSYLLFKDILFKPEQDPLIKIEKVK
ncbi:hypothetical protein CD798_08200 [Bacillaceae bacterium SAOS 7]|nr:hypothetical protein CD798_08200 [Bacillaceae bacterium SAOS 7]